MKDLVEIGYVARAHGIKGELRVVVYNPSSTALQDAERIFVGGQPFTVGKARPSKDATLVTLSEVTSRERAEELKGSKVEIDRDALELEEGELLLSDLIGCAVVLRSGEAWGKVAEIEWGAQDRLVIHDGEVERLLPLVDELVVDIDLEARVVTVDPPEGLPETPLRRKS